jgi:5'-3' exonuclease|tara:strand:+ start:7199 stop:7885 length:687 start_codon:yes stop_codon:yes gene_type:complete
MVALFDADSLVWASSYGVEEDIDLAIEKYNDSFTNIIYDLNEIYDISEVITFNNSKGNFRKILDTNYKANRKSSGMPSILTELHDYVTETYNSVSKYSLETDDLVAAYWKNIAEEDGRDTVIIVSIDKDYKQLPALIYNYHYKHRCVYDIEPVEALYNFYEQMIIGDSIDNVNYCRGYGKKYAEKLLKDCTSHYQFTKKVYELFTIIYKSKAKLKYIQCYNLLKLRTE